MVHVHFKRLFEYDVASVIVFMRFPYDKVEPFILYGPAISAINEKAHWNYFEFWNHLLRCVNEAINGRCSTCRVHGY